MFFQIFFFILVVPGRIFGRGNGVDGHDGAIEYGVTSPRGKLEINKRNRQRRRKEQRKEGERRKRHVSPTVGVGHGTVLCSGTGPVMLIKLR